MDRFKSFLWYLLKYEITPLIILIIVILQHIDVYIPGYTYTRFLITLFLTTLGMNIFLALISIFWKELKIWIVVTLNLLAALVCCVFYISNLAGHV